MDGFIPQSKISTLIQVMFIETVADNFNERIKAEANQIVAEELERIKNDPVLCKLLPE